jgi:hypothetical protein
VVGWNHSNANWKPKACVECGNAFIPKSGVNKFCSEKCKGSNKYTSGKVSTESQYKEISGDWNRYLSRLLYSAGRRRDGLTREILLRKLEQQNYLCAITKLPLTCELRKGENIYTNASVDQRIAAGGYTEDNIQLVCRIVNIMKWNLTQEELYIWCERILNGKKESL